MNVCALTPFFLQNCFMAELTRVDDTPQQQHEEQQLLHRETTKQK